MPQLTPQLLQTLQQAAKLHSAGKLAEAEPMYRRVLGKLPDNFDALHLLGVICAQTRRFDEAETLLRRAVHVNPKGNVALSNLGNLLREKGQARDALPFLRRAIELDPKFPAGHQNLGVALNDLDMTDESALCFERAIALSPNYPEAISSLAGIRRVQKKYAESEQLYRRALGLRPNYAEALTGLGATLAELDRDEESLAVCRRAAELRPDLPEAQSNLAVALLNNKQLDDAETAVRQAMRLRRDYADAFGNLGAILAEKRRYGESLEAHQRAVELRPTRSQNWMHLGAALRRLRRFDEAVDACKKAIELNPTGPMERYNLGVIHLDLCQVKQAIATFRQAISLEPDKPLPHWGLALALLVDGQYAEGWREYEWRWRCTELFGKRQPYPPPVWDGSDPAGKTLFVYVEQGFGDAIQFVRYVPLLAERGARVIVHAHPATRALFSTLAGVQLIHCEPEPIPPYDFQCALLSLPNHCGTTLRNVPANVPYLSADPEQSVKWKEKLAAIPGQLKVGIAWCGNPEHQRDQDRSCPFGELAPLFNVPGVSFVSLQKGAAPLITEISKADRFYDFTAELETFADTAALIEQLDLVITVDTAVAHLAGAMGKPTWVLLAFSPDWRWLLDRADSPWYPTARLFRQSSPGEWGPVISAARAELMETAAGVIR